jgi:hypothetical protein
MALSPQYGWAEPDNSSLVKNGAQDIRALGDAIDTSLWNVGYGQAGKNKIINGDFAINQRAFTSNTTTSSFNFDRWSQNNGGTSGTLTTTPQAFTPGAAPVAGYEAANFLQGITASGANVDTFAFYQQRIEDVRTFAGQTATFSFWAKASTGTPKIALELGQNYGTGGSPSTTVLTTVSAVTISTSWARYSITTTVPSLSGKTLGTSANTSYLFLNFWISAGSNFNARASSIGLQNNTFQIWGMQAEYGSKATPFQTASGGSPQSELAMCQRYYTRFTGGQAYTRYTYACIASTTTAFLATISLPVTLRTQPSSIDFGNLALQQYGGQPLLAVTACVLESTTQGANFFTANLTTASGGIIGSAFSVMNNNNTAGYIGVSAEL